MSWLAAIRPDEWDLPLFVHVLGALTLVGSLVMAATYLFTARRGGSAASIRLGYRSLLFAALPAYLVMRIAAQWLLSEEGLEDSEATWVTIGFLSTDVGLLALIGATVAAGLAVRRAREGSARSVAIAAWLVTLLIAIYAVTIWVMAAKPE